jgi:glyoxylase-like metal-dependent hydrolase (beta-lactamase superfamily II)
MNLFSYYSVSTFSNIYILACPASNRAVIVDPARFEAPLLEFIESNGLALTHILITRPEIDHEHGVRTLRRIYDADIFAGVPEIAGYPTTVPGDTEEIAMGETRLHAMTLPAHSQDARAYRCGHLLFSGPVLHAGGIAGEHPGYSGVLLREMIRERLLSLPAYTLVLPREGPPTTIGLEKTTNPALTAERSEQG